MEEELWHFHAEGVLTVALTNMNFPQETWRSARLLRAVPTCRLVLMLAYHLLSLALSMSVTQATIGLQNWKCAGRRLVQIGGRLPTANQLHKPFVKILSKHLAANKKVSLPSAEVEHRANDEP